jgi:hypothetical protein
MALYPGYRDPVVDDYIAAQRTDLQPILSAARSAIHMAEARVVEVIKWEVPFFVYCGNLCYLNTHNDKVLIGFYRGAELYDPHHLLHGSGKQVRHYIIRTPDACERPELLELIATAALLNEDRKARPAAAKGRP